MNTTDTGSVLATVLTGMGVVLLFPLALFILALPITYWWRRRQTQANPQIRFNKPFLRACLDTFLYLFPSVILIFGLVTLDEDNRIRIEPHFEFLRPFIANPLLTILMLVGIGTFAFFGTLLYVMYTAKPMLYRADYERALTHLRWWRRVPGMNSILGSMESGALLFSGGFAEAEQLMRKSVAASQKQSGRANERNSQGMLLDNLGWAVMRQGRYEEAIKFLEESIEKYPTGADNFSGLAEAYLWQGLFPDQALAYLERGIENKRYRMNVDRYVWGELLANRAWAQAQLGLCAEARQSIQQALAETETQCIPALAGIHVRAAYALRLCGSDAEALDHLKQAVQLDPNGAYGQMAKKALGERGG